MEKTLGETLGRNPWAKPLEHAPEPAPAALEGAAGGGNDGQAGGAASMGVLWVVPLDRRFNYTSGRKQRFTCRAAPPFPTHSRQAENLMAYNRRIAYLFLDIPVVEHGLI